MANSAVLRKKQKQKFIFKFQSDKRSSSLFIVFLDSRNPQAKKMNQLQFPCCYPLHKTSLQNNKEALETKKNLNDRYKFILAINSNSKKIKITFVTTTKKTQFTTDNMWRRHIRHRLNT